MNPIEETDIERSWAEHFPKRLVNGHSKTVCAYICLIVSHKAQHETANVGAKNCDWSYESLVCQRRNFIDLKVSASSHEEADT